MELWEVLIKKEFVKNFGFLRHEKMEDFIESLKKISKAMQDENICQEHEGETHLLKEMDLPTSVLKGLRIAKVESIADLKIFILLDEGFKKTGALSIRGVGVEKTKEVIDKIPGLREFCQNIKEP
jgi:hypothetical protein